MNTINETNKDGEAKEYLRRAVQAIGYFEAIKMLGEIGTMSLAHAQVPAVATASRDLFETGEEAQIASMDLDDKIGQRSDV